MSSISITGLRCETSTVAIVSCLYFSYDLHCYISNLNVCLICIFWIFFGVTEPQDWTLVDPQMWQRWKIDLVMIDLKAKGDKMVKVLVLSHTIHTIIDTNFANNHMKLQIYKLIRQITQICQVHMFLTVLFCHPKISNLGAHLWVDVEVSTNLPENNITQKLTSSFIRDSHPLLNITPQSNTNAKCASGQNAI